MQIAPSELIINEDGSIYHLKLKPDEIAQKIITVGDPDRVDKITKYMSHIHVSKKKREFYTVTGEIDGENITVISTGIGSDNIDIVFNELDALVNIDFETREIKDQLTKLTFFRLGTSGALQPDIPVDAFVASEYGVGLEGLIHYYDYKAKGPSKELEEAVRACLCNDLPKIFPYAAATLPELIDVVPNSYIKGITLTMGGFYGPQGRKLRINLEHKSFLHQLQQLRWNGKSMTNFEMETSAIYAMASLLGHRALSFNVILANRALGTFSPDPAAGVENLIKSTLPIICEI
jgi:uridine phosphorylase